MNPRTIRYLLAPLVIWLLLSAPAVQAQFKYSTNNGTITINGYSGSGGALTIPIRITGLPVTSIGTSAFISLTSLTSVTIPDSVTSIGDTAFAYCTELTSVYFTGNAPAADATVFTDDNNATIYYNPGTTGWSSTFAGRPAVLESTGEAQFGVTTDAGKITITAYSGPNAVIIPSTINGLPVTGIGAGAFINLTTLTSVTIPTGVTSIGDSAFAYCVDLTNVTIPNSVSKLGVGVFFASGLPSVTIPESVTSIPGDTFEYCTNLASVTIPSSVTSVGSNAFGFCGGLTNVTIPNSVQSIGNGAFENCDGLTNVTIPGSVRLWGGSVFASCANLSGVTLAYGVTNIGTNEFGYCGSLTNITIPTSVTNIGQYAFFECSNLSSITIPNKIRSIGNDAFAYCANLSSVTISNGVTNIGVSAFYYCTALSSIVIPGSVRGIGGDTFAYCANLSSVTISNGVHSIGGDAFAYCPVLAGVVIPDSVTNIGGSAFYACSSLFSVTIPDSVRVIADDTFAYCDSLTSVTISNGVRGIGDDAFYACGNLSSITIPTSVTNVGVSAFYACSNLSSVSIPTSVRGIGDDAFAYCAGLSSVTISNGARSIGEYAFLSCVSLASVTIPSSVTNLGEWAFQNCSNLASVSFGGHAPTADATAFSGDSNVAVYYLPGTGGWSGTFDGVPAYEEALQVTLGPAAAIAAGAEWQVDGGTWQESGASVAGLAAGRHTLSFKTISGWTPPTNQTITIKGATVAKATGTYSFSAQGIYNGLFMRDDVTTETAGMLGGLNVTASGTYSGKLLAGGATNAISGVFNVSGQASNLVGLTAEQGGPLTVTMTLNWGNSPPNITGTVSGSNGAWTANLTSELALKTSSSAEYTAWVLPAAAPPGYGYLLMTNHEGAFALSVSLADGTSFSQAVPLSGTGDLPVYGNLYGGKGLLLGWISLDNGSLTGNLAWIKPASSATALYTNGFTNQVLVQGSVWTNPAAKTAALDLPSGQLAISGGSLPANLAFNVALGNNNALTKLGGSSNSLSGSLNPKTGLLSLTFGNGDGKATTAGTAAALQSMSNAAGFFLGRTNAGSIFLLQP